ncbi:MAG TPA: hypothetical protein VF449_04405 [Parvibaculum sp.]
MAKFLAALCLAAAVAVSSAACAALVNGNPAALPHDKASLQKLDTLQMGILRAAVRYCNAFAGMRHEFNFCVTTNTDRDIRQSGNEALKAFHFGLPPMSRYDEGRSYVDIQRVFHVKP